MIKLITNLTYIYVTYIFLTEIVIVFECYGVTTTQLTEFVRLYVILPWRWSQ
jgi:hypothetical protein